MPMNFRFVGRNGSNGIGPVEPTLELIDAMICEMEGIDRNISRYSAGFMWCQMVGTLPRLRQDGELVAERVEKYFGEGQVPELARAIVRRFCLGQVREPGEPAYYFEAWYTR